jgi:tetratricopeptide (TPR) repeat protein
MRMALILSAVLLASLGGARARAQTPSGNAGKTDVDKAHARDAFRRATHAYDFGEYAKALEAFKEAYTAYEDPGFLFNIAQCHRQLGQTEEALRVYRSYLRNATNPPNAEEVRGLIARLEKTLDDEKRNRFVPPQGMQQPGDTGTATVATPQAPAQTTAPATTAGDAQLVAAPPDKPLVKKPWFWAVVGGAVVVVGAAVVVGVVVGTRSPSNPVPSITTVNGN